MQRIPYASQAVAWTLLLCAGGASAGPAEPPPSAQIGTPASAASNDAPAPAPQESFFSSVKQAFKEDVEREVVRGHFDVGSPPDTRRYYCLVDAKTGKSEPNGVAGEPVARKDGMTGIKGSAVSLFSCASAEQQGLLVTSGYVLHGAASHVVPAARPQPQLPVPAQAEAPAPAQAALPAPPLADGSPGKVDVAGVRLGMSVDEVRAVLRSKKLHDYYESGETLGHGDSPKAAPTAGGRFVNIVAAWTAPSVAAGDSAGADGEAFEVMFTPVPGRERAMAIIHSVSYAPMNALHESTLDQGLVRKYGGYTGSGDLPVSPTWRIQNDGGVQVGDPCNRRGTLGWGELKIGNGGRPNLALKTTLDEFQFQIDHCGVAIVTEDHSTVNGAGSKDDRLVVRFTVTAYSPSIGLQGATMAAQWIQPTADASNGSRGTRPREQPAPAL